MTRLEEELRAALQREDAPEDFATRVLAHVAERQQHKPSLWHRLQDTFAVRRWQWATAAVAVIVIATGAGLHVEEQRRAEGEQAKRQVMLALQIAGEKWNVAAREINGQPNLRDEKQTHKTENQE